MPGGSYVKRMPWGQQKPPVGYGIDWTHPIASGIVGCWLFNEQSGSLFNDLARGNNALSATPAWTPDGVNPTGANNSIIPKDSTPFISGGCTLVFYYRDNKTASNSQTLWSWIGSRTTAFSMSWAGYTGRPILYLKSGDVCFAYYNQANLKDGNWHHVALVLPEYSAAGVAASNLYMDGVARGIYSSVTSSEPDVRTTARIGDSLNIFGLKASLQHFYYYNRALSASEIRQLYISPYSIIEGWNYGRSYSVPTAAFINSSFWYQNPILEAI